MSKPLMTTDDTVDALLRGAVDPHVHSGPSTANRLLDHIDLIEQAAAAGYRAVVTKDHYYSGAPTAALVNAHYGQLGTRMFSGIVLNHAVGGLNPHAVEHTALMGGKYVWLPTLSSRNHIHWQAGPAPFSHPGTSASTLSNSPIDVLTSDGSVVDDLKAVLDLVAQHDMVLASGHLSIAEIFAIFVEAKKRGVTKLVVTHPEEVVRASLSEVSELVRMGAVIEHAMCLFVPGSRFVQYGPDHLHDHIEAAGVAHTVLGTDLGQSDTIGPIEGMRQTIRMCLDVGYTEDQIVAMTSTNAARLLGL